MEILPLLDYESGVIPYTARYGGWFVIPAGTIESEIELPCHQQWMSSYTKLIDPVTKKYQPVEVVSILQIPGIDNLWVGVLEGLIWDAKNWIPKYIPFTNPESDPNELFLKMVLMYNMKVKPK